jgi:subtilisin family serine protease
LANRTAAPPQNASPAYFSGVGEDPGTLDLSYGKTRGETVDVAGPGMKITAPVATSDGVIENRTSSGTSMATPIDAGHGAVLLSADSSLVNDSEAFEERVFSTARRAPNGGVTEVGHGIPSSVRAINDNVTEKSQSEVRTASAKARDAANRGLAARFDTFGSDFLRGIFKSWL